MHLPVNLFRYQYLAQRCLLLKLCCHVERIANGRIFLRVAHLPKVDRAGVNANSHSQLWPWSSPAQFSPFGRHAHTPVKQIHLHLHRQCRLHRPFRVVMTLLRQPKQGNQAVPGVFIHRAAPRFHHPVQPLPQPVHRLPDLFHVHGFRHGGEAGKIGHQHQNGFVEFGDEGGLQNRKLITEGNDGGINHLIA